VVIHINASIIIIQKLSRARNVSGRLEHCWIFRMAVPVNK